MGYLDIDPHTHRSIHNQTSLKVPTNHVHSTLVGARYLGANPSSKTIIISLEIFYAKISFR